MVDNCNTSKEYTLFFSIKLTVEKSGDEEHCFDYLYTVVQEETAHIQLSQYQKLVDYSLPIRHPSV